jgi:outer membrane murein-binding lipoprotein Lpp
MAKSQQQRLSRVSSASFFPSSPLCSSFPPSSHSHSHSHSPPSSSLPCKLSHTLFVLLPKRGPSAGTSGSGGSKLSLTPQSQTLNLFGVEYHLKTSDTISEADTSVGELSDDEDEGDVFAAGDKEKDNLPPSSSTTIIVPKEKKKKGSRILGWTTASLPSSVVIAHTQQPAPTPDLPIKSGTVSPSPESSTSWKPSKPHPYSKGSENSGEVETLKTKVKELEEQLETSKKAHQKELCSSELEKEKLSSNLQQLIASSKAKSEEKEKEKEKVEEEKVLHSRIAHANTELLELRSQFEKAGERLEEETILRIQLEKQGNSLPLLFVPKPLS